MQSKSSLEYTCRVFRCFTIYNCNTQEVIISIRRQCGALFANTIARVKDYVKQNIMDSQRNQIFIAAGDRCEWHGILDEKENCYFLMMTFPSSNVGTVRQSLLELQQITHSILNYSKFKDADFPQQKRSDLAAKLDELEQKYVNDHGPEGQPDQNEQNEAPVQQQSKVSQQFLHSTPQIQQKSSIAKSKINEQYHKFSVYRCFFVYNVKENKNLFLMKRGCVKSLDDSKVNLIQQLKRQISETTKFDVYMQGNSRSEWHGILDDSKFCYFLMMTFPSTQQIQVKDCLQDLQKLFKAIPNYDKMVQHDLEKRLNLEIGKMIDNLEVKYFNVYGNEGHASEAESDIKKSEIKQSEIRRDFLDSKPMEPSLKNFKQPQQQQLLESKSQKGLNPNFKQSDSLMPPEIGESGQKLIESSEMNVQQELRNLKMFRPNLQDAQIYIYGGIGCTVCVFIGLIIFLA